MHIVIISFVIQVEDKGNTLLMNEFKELHGSSFSFGKRSAFTQRFTILRLWVIIRANVVHSYVT
jgi:hypothetical protein